MIQQNGKLNVQEQSDVSNSKNYTARLSTEDYTLKINSINIWNPRTIFATSVSLIAGIDPFNSINHTIIILIQSQNLSYLNMPYYWKWLYRPRTEQETEQDKILRKLSFKLPVVLRYNLIFGFFFGVLGAFYTKKASTILYPYRFLPIAVAGLCHQEIYRYYRFVEGLPPLEVPKNTVVNVQQKSYY